jgi:hypothetical protein
MLFKFTFLVQSNIFILDLLILMHFILNLNFYLLFHFSTYEIHFNLFFSIFILELIQFYQPVIIIDDCQTSFEFLFDYLLLFKNYQNCDIWMIKLDCSINSCFYQNSYLKIQFLNSTSDSLFYFFFLNQKVIL